jgi:hypothetical protein
VSAQLGHVEVQQSLPPTESLVSMAQLLRL